MSQRIAQHWNAMSDYYIKYAIDQTTKVYTGIIPFLNLQNCERVAEAGCGPGLQVQEMLKLLSPTAQIEAWDLTEKFIQYAQNLGIQRCNFQLMNNEELNFPDSHFDAYIANLSLQIVDNPQQMVNEAYRVLKQGGIAGFSVWNTENDCTQFKIINEVMQKYKPSPEGSRSNFHCSREGVLENFITAAGFNRFLIFDESYYSPKSIEELVEFAVESPGAKAIKAENEETFSNLAQDIREAITDLVER